jgi:hypothetical protein
VADDVKDPRRVGSLVASWQVVLEVSLVGGTVSGCHLAEVVRFPVHTWSTKQGGVAAKPGQS